MPRDKGGVDTRRILSQPNECRERRDQGQNGGSSAARKKLVQSMIQTVVCPPLVSTRRQCNPDVSEKPRSPRPTTGGEGCRST